MSFNSALNTVSRGTFFGATLGLAGGATVVSYECSQRSCNGFMDLTPLWAPGLMVGGTMVGFTLGLAKALVDTCIERFKPAEGSENRLKPD